VRTGPRVRLVASALVGLVLVVGQSQTALAEDDPASAFDDQQVVEVTTDGSDWAAGLAVHHTQSAQVTATNAAVAYTSCDGCLAVALSFQVVIADGGPSSLQVGNLALAMNEGCTGCEAVAVADEVVIASDQRLVLTGRGHHALADLRHQLRDLARSDLPIEQIQTEAEQLMGEVAQVLATELHARATVHSDHDLRRRTCGRGRE
jgi:hypothetical protein